MQRVVGMVVRSCGGSNGLSTEICVRWVYIVGSVYISTILSMKDGREVRVLQLVIFSHLKTMGQMRLMVSELWRKAL